MAVIVVNCAAAVDATPTIPSSALTAAAKTPLPLPPSTVASINNNDCYCRRRRLPSQLLHSQRWTVAVVFVNGDSNGKGVKGKGNGEGGKGKGAGAAARVVGARVRAARWKTSEG